MKPTRYLSVKEVAAILGLSNKTIYKLINKGYIAGHFNYDSIHLIDEEVFLADLKARATVKHTAKKISERGDKHHLLR